MMKNNQVHKTLLFVCLLIFSAAGMAQTIRVQAPQTVYEGNRFSVQFIVDDTVSNFRGPSFKGFSTLSASSSVSIVNGNVSRSTSTTFTYILVADQVGTYNVGAATAHVDGKDIQSQPFSITVEKGNPQQQQAQNQRGRDPYDPFGDPWGQQAQQQQPQQQPQQLDNKTIFARASISKSNLYEGEQAIITYKIYTQVPVSQYQIDKLPGNKGFWAEDLTSGHQPKQQEETIDGRRYMVAEIRRGALFPQENGQLRIAPLDLDVLAIVQQQQQRRRTGSIWDLFFDDPFFNTRQAVEKHLTSNSLNVNVRPLPTAPEGFVGAVGRFDVKGTVDTRNVRANEAITYSVTISGSGNLMLINEPKLALSSAFEVYDPQVKDNINRSDNGISGSRTYEWIIIPRAQGEYQIPEFRFAYFDPHQGQYVTKTIDAIQIHVDKGDPNATQSVSITKSDVQVVNHDINYIKTSNTTLRSVADAGRTPLWFWIALILVLLATLVAIIVGRRRQEQAKDIVGTRLRRATREARRRLKRAEAHLKDLSSETFYEEIYKAIWGVLADKFNIPLAELSSDTVRDSLSQHNVPQAQQEHILKTLADVDFARFAPGDPASRRQQIYDEALEMIASL